MKHDRNSSEDVVVSRSREISEDRWLAIKGELDEARAVSLTDIEPPAGLSESKDATPCIPSNTRV